MAKQTKKPRVKSKWEKNKIKTQYNTGEVVTKPNQTASVRDILFRNTAGMSYDNYKTPYYEEQATFSSIALNEIQDMEPVEKLQYLKEVNSKVKDHSKKIKDHEEEKAAIAKAQAEAMKAEPQIIKATDDSGS